jgi:exodeoxyribonuclease V
VSDPDVVQPSLRRKITLSAEQQQGLTSICRFVDNPSHGNTYVMMGPAGSGKTVLLAEVAHLYPSALLVTFTGKAASVLSRKTGLHVSTIHQAIYSLREERRLATGKSELEWDFTGLENDASLLLLDECSMIGETIARDLLRTGARIIAVGDPGQLPPVKDSPFFHRPDFLLTEIHRQALESPIIRQAHNVRCGKAYANDGTAFRVVQRVTRDDVLEADVLLCWKNITRLQLNHLKRAHLGITHLPPQAGEPLMCLMNQREYGIYNGATYTLLEDYTDGDPYLIVDVDGHRTRIANAFVETYNDTAQDPFGGVHPKQVTRDTTPFAYGYACTVHKSQGSEWPFVILVDEYSRSDGYKEWCYTGITRAQERIKVQRPWG